MSTPTTYPQSHQRNHNDDLSGLIKAVEANVLYLSTCNFSHDSLLANILQYQLSIGSSRTRAIMSLQIGQIYQLEDSDRIALASACELIHQASLIHDDLQDEQLTRRNKPSVWAVYGKNNALCAGDLLISAAFRALADCSKAEGCVHTLKTLHQAVAKVIKGQTEDISARDKSISLATYEEIVLAKSGGLLQLPLDLVLSYTGKAIEEEQLVKKVLFHYILVYQGLDDLDDYEQDWLIPEALKSPNLIAVMLNQYTTLEKATRAAEQYIEEHLRALIDLQNKLPKAWANVLTSDIQKMSKRVSQQQKTLNDNSSRSSRAIVIGGGFGGIAAALRLRAKGYSVRLIERLPQLGGRAQVYTKEGFRHDAGPTVITAPFLLTELFALFNKKIDDYIELKPLNPWYRFVFADGSSFNYGGTIEETLQEIARFNPADQEGYLKLVAESKKIFEVGFQQLADKPFNRFTTMLRSIPHLIRLKSHKSVWQFVSGYLKDPRLRQAFSIQPLLVGGNPFDTSCIYSLIHYLEREWGISFPMGGTGALIAALNRLLIEEGVELSLNTSVQEIAIKNKKAYGVVLSNGDFIPAELIVSNADTPYCYTHMISKSKQGLSARIKTRYAKFSMGLFVLYFGSTRTYPDVAHHTICLGTRYKSLLKDIFDHKKLTEDFSMYVHRPTATDPSFAPPECDSFYVLVPVPNLQGDINWKKEGPLLRDAIIQSLSKSILPDIEHHLVADFFKTPEDFKMDYLSLHGAGFSIAPLLSQSAWFRYHNRGEGIEGLYHVGAGTHPGAGVPGVLSSAKVVDSMIQFAPMLANKEALG